MNLLKRAWLYISRQKVRSVILLLIFIVISTFVLTGLSIQRASADSSKKIQSSVGGTINLTLDTSSKNSKQVEADGQNQSFQYIGDKITKETVNAINKVPGVKECNAESKGEFLASAVNFKYLPTQIGGGDMQIQDMEPSEYGFDSSMSVVMSSKLFTGFMNGNLKLETGRHLNPDDENKILISKELADYNRLSVGDKIKVHCWENKKTIELEIIGIFSGTEGESKDALLPMDRAGNQGIVDFKTVTDGYGSQYAGYSNINIYVDDAAKIKDVYDKIGELNEVKGKTFKLSINNEDYNNIADPLESLQSLVRTLMIIIIIVSVIILTLLLTIWIRGRKREVGILLSIGKEKASIISQFIIEVALIAIFAFGISFFTSNIIANSTADFLSAQVEQSQKDSMSKSESNTNPDMVTADSMDKLTKNNKVPKMPKLEVNINSYDIIYVYIIGAVVILFSVILASFSVIKYRPKDILTRIS